MSKKEKISYYIFPIYIITVLIFGTITLSIDAKPNIIVPLLINALSALTITLITLKILKKSPHEALDFLRFLRINKSKIKNIIKGSLTTLGVFIALYIISTIILNLLGVKDAASDVTSEVGKQSGILLAITFILVSFIIPIIEEIFYRGLLLRLFEESKIAYYIKGLLPVMLSSVCFALTHFQGLSSPNDYIVLLTMFFMGVNYSLLARKYNSLAPSIGGHITINTIQMLLLLLAS